MSNLCSNRPVIWLDKNGTARHLRNTVKPAAIRLTLTPKFNARKWHSVLKMYNTIFWKMHIINVLYIDVKISMRSVSTCRSPEKIDWTSLHVRIHSRLLVISRSSTCRCQAHKHYSDYVASLTRKWYLDVHFYPHWFTPRRE